MNRRFKILVVDDNRELVHNIRDILEAKGYVAVTALDGGSAIELCRKEPFDLVLLDYKLPDMDGLQLQEKLSAWSDADVIIITGHASIESAAEAVHRKKIAGYETKPLDMERLLAFIQQVAERRRAEVMQERFFRISADMLCLISADGYFKLVNPAFENTLGYAEAELLDTPLARLIHPEDAAATLDKLAQHIHDAESFAWENRCQRQDGVYRWLSWNIQSYGEEQLFYAAAHDITERRLEQEQIKANLREKEVLLREIHHRVKNNLAVVTALIQLQKDQTKDPQALSLMTDLYHRVMSMSYVHEELYQSNTLATIDFNAYLGRLSSGIYQAFSRSFVRIYINAENILLEAEKAIPCGLIVAELVSNALKHAFPSLAGAAAASAKKRLDNGEQPEIRIDMKKNGPVYTMIVSDNGVGLPEGFDPRRSPTLGMTLVKSWAEHQLRGKMEVSGGAGAKFTITFQHRQLP